MEPFVYSIGMLIYTYVCDGYVCVYCVYTYVCMFIYTFVSFTAVAMNGTDHLIGLHKISDSIEQSSSFLP